VHVEEPPRARTLVHIVHILRDQQEAARPLGIQPRQRPMRRIGLDPRDARAPLVVEAMHQRRIAGQRLGRADVLDAVSLPQAARAPEGGDAAFGGDAGAGQDDDVVDVHHSDQVNEQS